MDLGSIRWLAAVATLFGSAGLAAAPAPALEIAPLAYQQRTLDNGLTVLSIEDHASPNVAVQM